MQTDGVFRGIKGGWTGVLGAHNVELVRALEVAYHTPGAGPGTNPRDRDLVFEPFRWLEPDDVVVLLLGQDPYPRSKDACGVAFQSLSADVPHSARSIRNNLIKYGHHREAEGSDRDRDRRVADLGGWQRQGVLPVNVTPTVREGQPGSHRHIWGDIMFRVLDQIAGRARPVALLLGDVAASFEPRVAAYCSAVVRAPHPVIPSEEEFQRHDCFGDVNRALLAAARDPAALQIDWKFAF